MTTVVCRFKGIPGYLKAKPLQILLNGIISLFNQSSHLQRSLSNYQYSFINFISLIIIVDQLYLNLSKFAGSNVIINLKVRYKLWIEINLTLRTRKYDSRLYPTSPFNRGSRPMARNSPVGIVDTPCNRSLIPHREEKVKERLLS